MGRCNDAIFAFAAVILITALLPPSFAATCTWTGNSGNFTDPSNWLGGLVPGPEDDAIIDVGTSIITVNTLVKVKSLHLGSLILITSRLEVTTLFTGVMAQINFNGVIETRSCLQIGSNVIFNGTITTSNFGLIEGNGFTFNFVTMRNATWEDITFNNTIVAMRSDSELTSSQVHMVENAIFSTPPSIFSQSMVYWYDHAALTISGWDLRSHSIMSFSQIGKIDITGLVMGDGCGFDFEGSHALIHDFASLQLMYLFASRSSVILSNINLMRNIPPGAEDMSWRLVEGATLHIEFSHFEGTGFALRPSMDASTTIFFSHTTIIFSSQAIWLNGIPHTNLDHPFLQFSDCSLEWPKYSYAALPLHYTLFNNSILTVNSSTNQPLPWIFDGQTNLTGSATYLGLSSFTAVQNNNRILPSIDFDPPRTQPSVLNLGSNALTIPNSFRIGARSSYSIGADVTFLNTIEGDGSILVYDADIRAKVTVCETIEPLLSVKNAELSILANVSRLDATNSVINLRDPITGLYWKATNVIWRNAVDPAHSISVTPAKIDLYEPNTLENGIQILAQTVEVKGTLTWNISTWSDSAFLSASLHWIALSGPANPMNFKIVIADIYDTTPAVMPLVATPSQPGYGALFSFVKQSDTGPISSDTPLGDCFTIEISREYTYSAANRRNLSCSVFPPPIAPSAPHSSPKAEVTAPTKIPANTELIVGLAIGIPFFTVAAVGTVILAVWQFRSVPESAKSAQKKRYKDYKGKETYNSLDIQSIPLVLR